jgi:serine/threonine protein kinase
MPENIALRFFRQIVAACQHLHDQKIFHRDLKPSNILLSEASDDATLKLCDFGMSCKYADYTSRRLRCGTALCMAPEFVLMKIDTYHTKSELWSLGLLYLYMLMGTFPNNHIETLSELQRALKQQEKFLDRIDPMFIVPAHVSSRGKEFLNQILNFDMNRRMSWRHLGECEYLWPKTEQLFLPATALDLYFDNVKYDNITRYNKIIGNVEIL